MHMQRVLQDFCWPKSCFPCVELPGALLADGEEYNFLIAGTDVDDGGSGQLFLVKQFSGSYHE